MIETDFVGFFNLIKLRFRWDDNEGFWSCSGCKVKFDKPSKELHSSLNCSLSKLNSLQKLRQAVIEANPELYKKYCKSKGIEILDAPKLDQDRPVPLSWYKKQVQNLAKLPFILSQPSGAEK